MKKIKVNGVTVTLKEFSIYIGTSRQQIYNYLKNYTFEQIVKYKKKNNLTIEQAIEEARKNYDIQNKEQVISDVVKREQELIEQINKVQSKIDRAINLINNLIKNYYKGDYCLQDLENIKKELS